MATACRARVDERRPAARSARRKSAMSSRVTAAADALPRRAIAAAKSRRSCAYARHVFSAISRSKRSAPTNASISSSNVTGAR